MAVSESRRLDLFWEKVSPEPNSGCWLWTAYIDHDGYGRFLHSRGTLAHRFSYLTFVGEIPSHLEIDHLCRVHCCVNPDHLEAVTHGDNMRRGRWGKKSHCPQGHELNEATTYKYGVNGKHRSCIICRREASRRWFARRS